MKSENSERFKGGEAWRKVLHLIVLIVPYIAYSIGRESSIVILAGIVAFALLGDYARAKSAPFRQFIDRTVGFMIRESEIPDSGGKPVINGATWIFVSLLVLILVFPFKLALISFATFVVADAVATAVGMSFGKNHWPNQPETFEGSLAFFATAFAILLFGFKVDWTSALAGALVGSIVEAVVPWLNDNLTAPFAIASVIWAIQQFL